VGTSLTLKPFFGVMGVAPPRNFGRVTSVIPRCFGGNLDNKELVAGTTVYFPVFNDGALFSIGDGHDAQGDGEVCITDVETALRLIRQPRAACSKQFYRAAGGIFQLPALRHNVASVDVHRTRAARFASLGASIRRVSCCRFARDPFVHSPV